ncbi:hypothetical protein BOQ63_007435 [Streptomyces viridifaciens]|uniref:hypothetical protein n=1 Tax=Kitasatospora aureofaciens TaxID=1894 RepID=UPI000928DDF8|nr:hypothetical protein CP971_00610 [Streptomyces viridifaciens]UKZ03896.1 hypothetical protein BOQ63_007435 [Streptomyces viridifaciens]
MKISVRGGSLAAATSLLAVVPLLTGAWAPARAGLAAPVSSTAPVSSAAPVTDATCVLNAHGVFANAVGAGGIDLPLPDTLAMTGTLSCVDAFGAPLASGTFERTVTMPAAECTGDEHGDTSTTTVHWADLSTSTLRFTRTDVVKVNGTASLVVSGAVTADSARFAGDALSAVGTSSGAGCGTPAGETTLDSTLVLRLTH